MWPPSDRARNVLTLLATRVDASQLLEEYRVSKKIVYCENAPATGAESIQALIRVAARDQPDAIALLAPERLPLDYKSLWRRIEDTVARLSELGVNRGDRVAMVLPDGPEAALAFLSVSAFAACAPLNPGCQVSEIELCLHTLAPAAVLVPAGVEGAAGRVAQSRGILVIEVSPITAGEAGAFTLTTRGKGQSRAGNLRPDLCHDLCHEPTLILQTSGTTSRPKFVVHTRWSLYWAARSLAQCLPITPADRCLNLSPLFHSLGLTGGLLTSLAAGGSTVCTSGFRSNDFFRWLDDFSPTWYAAVPAIHESILEGAGDHRELIARSHLRFIRSAGAPLSQKLKAKVEQTMRAPMIEAYGMSETGAIAIEPFPPTRRKAGSAGLAAGLSIEVMDEEGRPVSRGETGEINVRGHKVAPGYWNNDAANHAAFVNGWFRTGDLGYLDDDGFLFVTGRINDLINRGGEKIAPLEVDEVLMEHPAVEEAAAFAIPDDKLGEEIAAAVVLHKHMPVGAASLQAFAATRLAAHKVPRRWIFLSEIPAGPNGKLSRASLSRTLAREVLESGAISPQPRPPMVAPSNDRDRLIAGIWASVLGVDGVGIHDNFFDCGGDSILGAELLARISQAIQIEAPPLSILLLAPTIATLSRMLDDPDYLKASSRIAPIQTHGSGAPFFCIGDGIELRQMLPHLDGRPCYGIRLHRFEDEPPPHRIESIAACCLETLQSVQPRGPYILGGWCFAGVVAFELARQLEALGEHVALLALFDTRNLFQSRAQGVQRTQNRWSELNEKFRFHSKKILELGLKQGVEYVRVRVDAVARRRIRGLWSIPYRLYAAEGRPLPVPLRSRNHCQALALSQYVPQPYPGRVVHFWATERPAGGLDVESEWAHLAQGGLDFHEIPGDHVSILQEPGVSVLACQLRPYFSEAAVPEEIVEV